MQFPEHELKLLILYHKVSGITSHPVKQGLTCDIYTPIQAG
jgi:hypothetical protein